MAGFIQRSRHAAGPDGGDRPSSAWRKRGLTVLRTTISGALIGVGVSHISSGLHEFDNGYRHAALGVFFIAAGLLPSLEHARRLRRSAGVVAPITGCAAADDPNLPLRLRASTHVISRAVLGGSVLCMASLAILLVSLITPKLNATFPLPVTLSIGLVGLLFSGACLVWLTQRRLDGDDALIADALGLFERSNALGPAARIPWRAIRSIRVVRFLNQHLVSIELCDPRRYIDQASGLRRLALLANQHLVGTPWCITPGTLGCRAEVLAGKLEARRAHYQELNRQ